MMTRMAGGRLAAALGAGALGAVGADMVMHDSTDRAAAAMQGYTSRYDSAPDQVKQVFGGLIAREGLTPRERMMVAGVLARGPNAINPAEAQAVSPEGAEALRLAAEVQAAAPALAQEVAALAMEGKGVAERMQGADIPDSATLRQAIDGGAGVSMVPALAGGAIGGSLGALGAAGAGWLRSRGRA